MIANDEDLRVTLERMLSRLRFSVRSLFFVVAAVAIGLVISIRWLTHAHYADVRQMYGGATGGRALSKPDRVDVYRLGKLPDDVNWRTATVSDYPILAGPAAMPEPIAKEVTALLSDPSSFLWDEAKACIPRPGIRLDFIRGSDRLEVLLCFECDILISYINGRLAGGEDFDPVRPSLVRAVGSLFPDDAVIQALREHR
jgi:hypothetical protein